MNSIKKYYQSLIAFLVKNRMKSTRVLMGVIMILILFAKPAIHSDTLIEFLMDWTGYFLVIICVLGRSFCSIFISGSKNEKLSTSGPYSIVRNPLYVFSFMGVMGIGLQIGMLSILILLICIFCLYYPEVVVHEEKFLLSTFGRQYQEYQQLVPRWVPLHLKFDIPQTIVVHPMRVLRTMTDAFLFFLAFPALELLEHLHHLRYIPTLFSLP